MGGYHDLYVESDTIKLTDVFQMYRKTLHCAYKEDPAKYLTLSLHTYDACLKDTKIKLQVLKDIDMANIIHYGKRKVIPHGITKQSNANNKYTKNYDQDLISIFINYLDASNLYGNAMSKKLPYRGLKCVSEKDLMMLADDLFKNYDIKAYDTGYIFDVDVDYPKSLYDINIDLPFLPKTQVINKCVKRVSNFYDKTLCCSQFIT